MLRYGLARAWRRSREPAGDRLRARLVGVSEPAPGTVAEITPAEARSGLDAGRLALVDVREPDEWRAGRAPGAVHIPLGALDARWGELAASGRTIAFVCRSGQRSAFAALVAERARVPAVNVAGGMEAWARAGLPMEPEGARVA